MTVPVPLPAPDDVPASDVVVKAVRCWRAARDCGKPVQPRLSLQLAPRGCAMLAPVLDSLIGFYELALGRPLAVGRAEALSDDERLLLGLVNGGGRIFCCAQGSEALFACALCSARIMLKLVLGQDGGPVPQFPNRL